jgi:hypothetical protein
MTVAKFHSIMRVLAYALLGFSLSAMIAVGIAQFRHTKVAIARSKQLEADSLGYLPGADLTGAKALELLAKATNGAKVDIFTDADAAGNHFAYRGEFAAAETQMSVDDLATLLRKDKNQLFLIKTGPTTLLVRRLRVDDIEASKSQARLTNSSPTSFASASAPSSSAPTTQDTATALLAERMDDLKDRYKSDNEAIRNELLRVYDFNKWMVGLMCTTLIGLLGLIVGNLVQSRRFDRGPVASSEQAHLYAASNAKPKHQTRKSQSL